MISLIHLFCADSLSLKAAAAQSKIGMLLMYMFILSDCIFCIYVHYVHICACFLFLLRRFVRYVSTFPCVYTAFTCH